MSKQHSRGFALVEVLMVIAILAGITSFAVFNLRGENNQQFEAFANELGMQVSLAGERAMMQPVEIGLSVKGNLFQFATYHQRDEDKKEALVPLNDTLFGKQKIPRDVQVKMEVQGQLSASPQILIAANGDMTPFTIYVGKKGEKPSYIIKGDVTGKVTHQWLA